MKEGWKEYDFENCLNNFPRYNKIAKKNFLLNGLFPIVSQEKKLINGYWNGKEDLIRLKKPVVIFGDHTKIIKYVDFDFVVGADGVKIFEPINEIDTRFFSLAIENLKLDDLGYARHYRILKQSKIFFPPLPEQQKIVEKLFTAFELIDQAKANIEKNIQNAKELFQSKLNDVFSQKGDGWEDKKLKDISLDFGRGKSKHRPRNYDKLYGGEYPFIQTGDIRNSKMFVSNYTQTYSELGLAQSKLWPRNTICITIAANIAESAITDFESCFPDSVIGMVVDEKKADKFYTYYALQFLKSEIQSRSVGFAQQNINLATFDKIFFPFPKSLKTQQKIVEQLDQLSAQTEMLQEKYTQKLANLEELKKSILEKAFKGELV